MAQVHLSAIHKLKERLQRENETLRDTKQQLRDVQDRIKTDKEVE